MTTKQIKDLARLVSNSGCPVLIVLGAQDQMTHPKAARSLVDAATNAGKSVQIATLAVGHHQMTEAPEETLSAIRGFLKP